LLAIFVEPTQVADDVALVAMRPVSVTEESLALSLPAEPRMLAQARRTLRQWLRESAVAPTDENEIVIACGEACANVVQHAYGRDIGVFELEARLVGAAVEVSVRDHGEWRAPTERGGGWGLSLMRSLMDSVLMDRSPDGTTVTMRRRVELGGRG
jgi:anti-sigma regulatory factor (Ser/Thr protein kinase)